MNDSGKADLLAKAMRRVFEEEIGEQVDVTNRNAQSQPADVERRAQEQLPRQSAGE